MQPLDIARRGALTHCSMIPGPPLQPGPNRLNRPSAHFHLVGQLDLNRQLADGDAGHHQWHRRLFRLTRIDKNRRFRRQYRIRLLNPHHHPRFTDALGFTRQRQTLCYRLKIGRTGRQLIQQLPPITLCRQNPIAQTQPHPAYPERSGCLAPI